MTITDNIGFIVSNWLNILSQIRQLYYTKNKTNNKVKRKKRRKIKYFSFVFISIITILMFSSGFESDYVWIESTSQICQILIEIKILRLKYFKI